MSNFINIINSFKEKTVGVIGDVMLDTFTYGHVERLSPEAPVPVVLIDNEFQMLGGAANVAVNIRALGGKVTLFGRIGNDIEGEKVQQLITKSGIDFEKTLLVSDGDYKTIEKRRVLVDNRHICRIDREQITQMSDGLQSELVEELKSTIKRFDILIICDYSKGTLTETLVKKLLKLSSETGKPVVVDTKPGNHFWYQSVQLITPNEIEVIKMTNLEDIHAAGKTLSELLSSPVLVTRGEKGMVFFENDMFTDYKATATNVVDVSGAGDTVIATCALALACECSFIEMIRLANSAAGLVVAKPGTASVTAGELLAYMQNHE